MRLRFRLKTALIVIALLSPPLAAAAVVARHGGIEAFRDHHTTMAFYAWLMADEFEMQARVGRQNGAPAEQVAELERRAREYFRKVRWHQFLSGGRQYPTAAT